MGPDCTHGDRSRRSSSVLCHVPNLHGRTTQKAVGCREGPTQTTAARFDVLYPRRWAENALRREEPMSACGGYRAEPLGGNRQMVAASAAVGRESNTIHLMTEVDITGPRRLITEHREHTGERLSLTGYVVACLARTLAEFPRFNSFRRGSRLIVLDDLTISVLFEREIDGENVPEPVGIQAANRKTYRQLNDKLRAAQQHAEQRLGSASGTEWIRFIPSFLLRSFVRLASRNIGMQKRFGVVGAYY